MKIERVWAMPNRWTFKIKPIADLLEQEVVGTKVDPFLGQSTIGTIRNDMQEDALVWLRGIDDGIADTVLYDPPYSPTQAKKYGSGKGYESKRYWSQVKHELTRVCKPGGKAICCGWNSGGLGKVNRFTLHRVLLVNHGGNRNDTIVTVEVKQYAEQQRIEGEGQHNERG